MATSAPRSAASTAARMPARPPPMTTSSCLITWTFPGRDGSFASLYYSGPDVPTTLVGRCADARLDCVFCRFGSAIEETVGVFAALLCVVKRFVGGEEQRLAVGSVVREHRNADGALQAVPPQRRQN